MAIGDPTGGGGGAPFDPKVFESLGGIFKNLTGEMAKISVVLDKLQSTKAFAQTTKEVDSLTKSVKKAEDEFKGVRRTVEELADKMPLWSKRIAGHNVLTAWMGKGGIKKLEKDLADADDATKSYAKSVVLNLKRKKISWDDASEAIVENLNGENVVLKEQVKIMKGLTKGGNNLASIQKLTGANVGESIKFGDALKTVGIRSKATSLKQQALGKALDISKTKLAEWTQKLSLAAVAYAAFDRVTEGATLAADAHFELGKVGESTTKTLKTLALETGKYAIEMEKLHFSAAKLGIESDKMKDTFKALKLDLRGAEKSNEQVKDLTVSLGRLSKVLREDIGDTTNFAVEQFNRYGVSVEDTSETLALISEQAEVLNGKYKNQSTRVRDVMMMTRELADQNKVYGTDLKFLAMSTSDYAARLKNVGMSHEAAQKAAVDYTKFLSGEQPRWMKFRALRSVSDDILQNKNLGDLERRLGKDRFADLQKLKQQMKGLGIHQQQELIHEFLQGTSVMAEETEKYLTTLSPGQALETLKGQGITGRAALDAIAQAQENVNKRTKEGTKSFEELDKKGASALERLKKKAIGATGFFGNMGASIKNIATSVVGLGAGALGLRGAKRGLSALANRPGVMGRALTGIGSKLPALGRVGGLAARGAGVAARGLGVAGAAIGSFQVGAMLGKEISRFFGGAVSKNLLVDFWRVLKSPFEDLGAFLGAFKEMGKSVRSMWEDLTGWIRGKLGSMLDRVLGVFDASKIFPAIFSALKASMPVLGVADLVKLFRKGGGEPEAPPAPPKGHGARPGEAPRGDKGGSGGGGGGEVVADGADWILRLKGAGAAILGQIKETQETAT